MSVRVFGGHASARCTREESDFKEEGFMHVFQRIDFFLGCGRNGCESHRSAVEFFDDGFQDVAIRALESLVINFQKCQRAMTQIVGHLAITAHLSKVAYASEKAIGNARSLARTI